MDRISAASATDIWAIGKVLPTIGGNPVPVARTLHWDGTAWSVLPGPNASDASASVSDLSALPSGEAWAVGTTFSTTGGSTTFIEHHTP